MEELDEILNQIMEVYQNNYDNDTCHKKASLLWEKYYVLSHKIGKTSPLEESLYLMLENESYIVNQAPIRKKVSDEDFKCALRNLNDFKCKKEKYLSSGDILCLLDWVVENTRSNLESLGFILEKNSLNGFCDISQAISLMPLEDMRVSVTKNSAAKSFGYPLNHYFGTVTFPTIVNDQIIEKTYLIDVTYRQFFSTVRCNYGRYFSNSLNSFSAPDPGYFVEDIDFAKELMANGYIELTEDNARKYGESFVKASVLYKDLDKTLSYFDSYLERILTTGEEYAAPSMNLEGFNMKFPINNFSK